MKLPLKSSALGTLLAALALMAAGCQTEAPQDDVSRHQDGASPATMPQPATAESPAPPADFASDTVKNDAKDAIGEKLKQDVAQGADTLKQNVQQAAAEMKTEHLGTTFKKARFEVPEGVRQAADEVKQNIGQIDGVVQQKAEVIEKSVQQTADQVQQGVKQRADMISNGLKQATDTVSEKALRDRFMRAKDHIEKKLGDER